MLHVVSTLGEECGWEMPRLWKQHSTLINRPGLDVFSRLLSGSSRPLCAVCFSSAAPASMRIDPMTRDKVQRKHFGLWTFCKKKPSRWIVVFQSFLSCGIVRFLAMWNYGAIPTKGNSEISRIARYNITFILHQKFSLSLVQSFR